MERPHLMGLLDVALYLELSPGYVHVLANMGGLPLQQTSSGKIFFREDVEQLYLQRLRRKIEGK